MKKMPTGQSGRTGPERELARTRVSRPLLQRWL